MATREGSPVIGAVDETFWERMRLVCMDLVSGYLWCEEGAEDRRYDPWPALVEARRKALGVGGLSRVSDRAKARSKLAETSQECQSVPEWFHLIHARVKRYALAIGGRLSQARQALSPAPAPRRQGQGGHLRGGEGPQALVEARAAEVTHWESVPSAYRHHLAPVSLSVPPWRLADSTRQTAAEVARQWHAETQAIEAFIETSG